MGNRSTSSNLVFCAKNTRTDFFVLVFFYRIFRRDSRVEPFCGSKMLCLRTYFVLSRSKAKDDVDNVGAGRAAKGENLVFCAKNTRTDFFVLVFFYRIFRQDSRMSRFAGAKCKTCISYSLKKAASERYGFFVNSPATLR